MNQAIEKGKRAFKYIFLSFAITIIIFILFIIFAMVFYPGGSVYDLNAERYSLLHNAFCNLREPIALNGEPNLISSSLIKTGITLFSIATMTFFFVLCFYFQGKKSTKYLSIIGTIFGIIQGPFFILIIFLFSTPEVHAIFYIVAPILLYIAVILYTIIFFVDKNFPKITLYSFLILSIASVLFSMLVGIATGVGGNFHKLSNSLGSNLFIYFTSIIYIIQGFSLYSFFKKSCLI